MGNIVRKNKQLLALALSLLLVFQFFSYQDAAAFVTSQFASKVLGATDISAVRKFGLGGPVDMEFDSSGNLWVSDFDNNRVLKYTAPFSTGQAASLVIGQPNLSSVMANNGGVSSNSLSGPVGINFDSSGNLWVADGGNHRVLKYTTPFSTGQAASLVIGQTSFTSSTSGTTSTTLNSPKDIAFDSSGNLWVADGSNNRVLKYTTSFSTGQAASLVIGQTGLSSGTSGTTPTTLSAPVAIRFDSSGSLWVADASNNRVLRFPPSFTVNGQAADVVIGQSSFTFSLIGTTSTTLNSPKDIVFDSSGNLWVADGSNNRVLKYTTSFSTGQAASLVIGQTGLSSGTSGTTSTTLSAPEAVMFDSSGNLFVADGSNNRVLKYTAPFSTGQAASLVLGQTRFTSSASNQGGDSATNFNNVEGIRFDSSGNLWVSDFGNNRVLKFTTPISSGQSASLVLGQSSLTTTTDGITSSTLKEPHRVAFDSSGNLWVVDASNNRVLKYTTPFSTGQAASLVLGQSDFITNTAGTTSSKLNFPTDIEFDSFGDLWVADGSNNRILRFATPFSTGQAANRVIGQAIFTTSTLGTTSTTLNFPHDIKFDSSGNLWVADLSNHRVLRYAPTFNDGQAAGLVIGQTSLSTGTSGTTSTTLSSPGGVTFDSSGNLWVSEFGNNRILKYTTPFSTGQAASFVLGQSGFTSGTANSGGVSLNTLSGPSELTFDSSGNLWVADLSNHRVLMFPDEPTSTSVFDYNIITGSQTTGTGSFSASLTATGSWATDTMDIQQTDSNPTGSSVGAKKVIGKFYRVENSSPEIVSSTSVSITYTNGELGPLEESSLTINKFSGGTWTELSTSVNAATNTASATTSGFSTFVLTGILSLSESVAVSDSLTNRISTKALSESAAVSDSLTNRISTKALSESAAVSDSLTNRISTKALSESAAVSDSLTNLLLTKALTEPAHVSDSLTNFISTKSLSESLLVSDTSTSLLIPLSEIVSISDVLTITTSTKHLSESVSISDSSTIPQIKPLSESVILSDKLITVLGPKILSLTASDPDQSSVLFSEGDVISIQFSVPTNQPFKGLENLLTKDDIDTLFNSTQSLGSNYTGTWTSSSILYITITNPTIPVGQTPPAIGELTLSVISSLLKDGGGSTSASLAPSPPLSGSFGQKAGPFIVDIIADDPDNSSPDFSEGDTITVRFSEPTNKPPASTKNNIDDLFTASQSLGTDYTGKYINAQTLVITIQDATIPVDQTAPQIGQLTLTVNAAANLKDAKETSDASAATSPPLIGSFGTFVVIKPVEAGETVSTTLPSGIDAEITVPTGGVITFTKAEASNTASDNKTSLGFIGTVVDIATSEGASCSVDVGGCPITIAFTDGDLIAAGVKLSNVVILHDIDNNGVFDLDTETLDTTITPSSPPGPYTATATAFFNSKFAVGGIKPALLLGGLLGGGGDFAPPTLYGKAFTETEYPLSIDGSSFKLKEFSNVISTKVLETGKPVKLKLLMYNDGGASAIEHIALYTNLRGDTREVEHSNTYIIFEKDKPLSVTDPNGFFSYVNMTESKKGTKFELTLDFSFAKPMDTSDVIIRAWDKGRNSADTKIFDAIKVVGSEVQKETIAESAQAIVPETITSQEAPVELKIPVWIKKNAGWWSADLINDSDFVQGIKYLMDQKIMSVPKTVSGSGTSEKIPSWVKRNAGWWSDGLVSDDEFVQAIQWLILNGIIKI